MDMPLSKTLIVCALLCMYIVSIQAPTSKDTNSLSPNLERDDRAHREDYPMERTNLYGGMVVDRQPDEEFQRDRANRLADEQRRTPARTRSRGAHAGGHTGGQ
ncbi:hypothetical protein DdX_10057 [Ditylenchus destructor]|uniref:Secreted protein n=1 Tax=Ditylenchus destructor TaxID=166010 RepID=A0AAD4N0P6_9BILA|nr:hypothetical protein DdX_10057 [Ditylenchus destructor]